MSHESPRPLEADRIARLEARIARLENHLGLAATTTPAAIVPTDPARPLPPVVTESLELEVGRNWFALSGVIALVAGAGLTLSLPFEGLPAVVPPLAGFVATGLIAYFAQRGKHSFETLAGYLRGAALALLYFATLRLCFPAVRQVCDPHGIIGRGVLSIAALLGAASATRSRSPWLLALALAGAGVALLATGSSVLFLGGLVVLAELSAETAHRCRRPWLPIATGPLLAGLYFAWALGNPFFATKLGFVPLSFAAPVLFLAALVVLALASQRDASVVEEDTAMKLGAVVHGTLGYGTFLVTTLAAFPRGFASLQTGASLAFLGLAAVAWHRRRGRVATFFYAMTGYGALTAAILKTFPAPELFVALSLQSVLVVATAIWFRSRLIVVANFAIYLAIVLGYVVSADRETGISLGFGLVALVTARLLNWQKDRLALKTELMRNAYLACAFVVFPYALAHLLPDRFVALAWIALAGAYYAASLAAANRKYRWMGHGTLLLTSVYLVTAGSHHADPVYRTLSFLLLGAVLLGVSLAFARAQRRAAADQCPPHPHPDVAAGAAGRPQAGDAAPSSSARPQSTS